jgi:erythromycin esterase-like protein
VELDIPAFESCLVRRWRRRSTTEVATVFKWGRTVLLLFLLAVVTAQTTPDQPPPTEWIRSHAIALQTVEAGHGFDDMQPLAKIVGDSRIVALGEATHGTHEFFQLKHRMLEFLASQKGFTIFSIEANMPEAYRLNDFVLNGKGNPKQLLKGMYFWTWDTEEVLNMILWMREFNSSRKGRIEFTGFDMQTPNVAMDTVRQFLLGRDDRFYNTVDSIYAEVAHRTEVTRSSFGVATGTFPVELAAGKHIEFSGYIKTEAVTNGWAGLWWRVDGEKGSKPLVFDNMQDRGPKGTTDWTFYKLSLDVPKNASHINFGLVHPGDGTAWFDSLKVAIDGQAYEDSALFDFDFESSALRGFHAGASGYEVSLDSSAAHSGKQSLRIRPTSIAKPFGADLPVVALAQRCKDILAHLQGDRERFLREGSKSENVDWVIQNARVVLQFMQLKTGEKSRDQSMAENVEWIADHNPGAKIVLWAHNGHVGYAAYPGFSPMGAYLRERFGPEMVNFGLCFSEGSFRAFETGKSLHEFTVGQLPEGSLDRALASARIPLFALDLRQLPTDGPVAQWFAEPRAMRSIGAVYSENDAESMAVAKTRWQEAFDVIFFVERTTAAHGNP